MPLLDAVGLAAAAGSLAGIIDGLGFVGSDFQGTLPAALTYAWASTVCAVVAAGVAQWTWCHLGRRVLRLEPAPYVVWTGLPLVAFACWVPHGWIVSHWRDLSAPARILAASSYAVVSALAIGVAIVVYGIRRLLAQGRVRMAVRYALLSALLGFAFATYLADRFVLVGLYDDFHHGLTVALVLSLVGALALARVIWESKLSAMTTRRRDVAWLVPSVALGFVLAFELSSPDVFGPSQSVVFQKLITFARHTTDFDGDGASAHFGGTDCSGFDARLAPGRFDFPANGKDEDCSGKDSEWPLPAPRHEYAVPAAEGFNVVLITVDALRADHLGSYGYARNTSPTLDALAAKSVRFSKAISPASKTFGSLPAMMSGLYPSNVPRARAKDVKRKTSRKAVQRSLFDITTDAPMLAELFGSKGYQTATFLSNGSLLLLSLGRGFQQANTGKNQVEESIAALDAHTGPFFHWLHLNAPHAPYQAHPEHPFGHRDIDRYDSEIAHDDARIGQLLKALEERNLMQKTIVIVSADHGEEFREHGGQFHSFRLYRELIHVPLIIHIPGVEPSVIAAPVEVMGLTATLCELFRLLPSCDRFDGRSLLGAIAGHTDDWGAFSELVYKDGRRNLQSLYTQKWHLIRDYGRDRIELYDVVSDPNEKKNVATKHPEITRELAELVALRPLARAGAVFRQYERTGDLAVVASGLHALQNPTILPHAFRLLSKEPKRFRAELAKLQKRPGLPSKLRSQATKYAKASTTRPKESAKKRPEDDSRSE